MKLWKDDEMKKLFFVLLVGLFFQAVFARAVLAKEGIYLGLDVPYTMIEGDFDGYSALIGTQDAIAIPLIKGAFGIGLTIGVGFGEASAVELKATDTIHNVEWLGSHGDAEHRTLGLLFKHSFLTSETFQPHITYGFTYNALILKDAANDTFGNIGDAKLTGYGIDLGAGLDHYVSPHYSIGLTLLYHLVKYSHAEGIQESGKIEHGLNGNGLGVVVGGKYHF